jgi:hypothetical protein
VPYLPAPPGQSPLPSTPPWASLSGSQPCRQSSPSLRRQAGLPLYLSACMYAERASQDGAASPHTPAPRACASSAQPLPPHARSAPPACLRSAPTGVRSAPTGVSSLAWLCPMCPNGVSGCTPLWGVEGPLLPASCPWGAPPKCPERGIYEVPRMGYGVWRVPYVPREVLAGGRGIRVRSPRRGNGPAFATTSAPPKPYVADRRSPCRASKETT